MDRKRGGYLDLTAEGILGREELLTMLAELQEARETMEKELKAVKERKEHVERLQYDRDA